MRQEKASACGGRLWVYKRTEQGERATTRLARVAEKQLYGARVRPRSLLELETEWKRVVPEKTSANQAVPNGNGPVTQQLIGGASGQIS